MSAHINAEGKFQSDKYPTCPAGKVPLSVEDQSAWDLLWEYAGRRATVDQEFCDDLKFALRAAGYRPVGPAPIPLLLRCPACGTRHVDAPGRDPHRTHACQECGELWAPAIVPTVGVKFLPGCLDPK